MLWSEAGRAVLTTLPLPAYIAQRRDELLRLYDELQKRVEGLQHQVEQQAQTTSAGVPVDDTSGSGTGDSIGDRSVSRGQRSGRLCSEKRSVVLPTSCFSRRTVEL